MNARRPFVTRTAGPACWLLLVPCLLCACGRQPQVSEVNRDLIVSLATAVSAKNTEWLEQNAKLIEQKKAEEKISQREYDTFTAIVSQAREGKWEEAQQEAYALRDAQRPTAEDYDNLAQRKLSPSHEGAKEALLKKLAAKKKTR